MQTKVTLIPILMHKWHSCDFARSVVVQFPVWTAAEMEMLYVKRRTPSHYFLF